MERKKPIIGQVMQGELIPIKMATGKDLRKKRRERLIMGKKL